MAVSDKVCIKLKAFEYQILEQSVKTICETVKTTGAVIKGPIPLPTIKKIVTILRAPHKYKDSREQFELRIHKRLIEILMPTQKTMEKLMKMELPAGVEIEIKVK